MLGSNGNRWLIIHRINNLFWPAVTAPSQYWKFRLFDSEVLTQVMVCYFGIVLPHLSFSSFIKVRTTSPSLPLSTIVSPLSALVIVRVNVDSLATKDFSSLCFVQYPNLPLILSAQTKTTKERYQMAVSIIGVIAICKLFNFVGKEYRYWSIHSWKLWA